jgi:uncharacterized protein (DUF1697 family)
MHPDPDGRRGTTRPWQAQVVSTRERWCIFLRAINTGGRRVTNEQLLAPFRSAGFDEVAAYQAAGNIVVTGDDDELLHHDALDPLLSDAYGFGTPSFVRSFARLRELVAEQPFGDEDLAATDGRIQLAFLRTEPGRATIAEVDELVPADDRVVIRGDALYWLPQTGVSNSRLPVGAIEQLVGPLTIRSLGTVERLLGRFSD